MSAFVKKASQPFSHPIDGRSGHPGHTFPFIARQTRAHLNFEVKDLRRPEAARLWRVLEFKPQIRFSAATR
jgi:hypothetical protein